MPKPKNNSNKQQQSKTQQEGGGEENENETPSFSHRLFKKYIPLVILLLILLVVFLAAFGFYLEARDEAERQAQLTDSEKAAEKNNNDEEANDEDEDGRDADHSKGLFAIPSSSCQADDFVAAASFVVGNFSNVIEKHLHSFSQQQQQETANLNVWIDRLIGATRYAAETDTRDKAAKNKKNENENNNNNNNNNKYTRDDQELISHLTFGLARWAKGVKSFVGTIEKNCDVETLLSSQHGVKHLALADELDENDEKVAAKEKSSSNKKKKSSSGDDDDKEEDEEEETEKKYSVVRFIGTKVIPVLYQKCMELLRFSYSSASSNNNNFEEEQEQLNKKMKRLLSTQKDLELIAHHVGPYRDVVIKTIMSMADVAFFLEREDYHTAFISHLVRLTDGVAALQQQEHRIRKITSGGKKSATATTKKDDVEYETFVDHRSSSPPSCLHPNSFIFCSPNIPTKLVQAKRDQLDYEGTPGEKYSPVVAYLFGLLRSAYMEEMISLNQHSTTLRISYGLSLMELQRYETAQKTLQAAERTFEEGNTGNEEDSSSRKELVKHSQDEIVTISRVLSLVLNCLEKDDMIEFVSDLNQQYNAQVAMRWDKMILNKCKKFLSDVNNEEKSPLQEQVEKYLTGKSLSEAVKFPWSLKHQKISGEFVESTRGDFMHLLLL